MHFDQSAIQFISEHRNPLLTDFFLLCTMIGDTNGYIFIILAIYIMLDKRLAIRLAAVVLLTSQINHLLKITIRNPRPFVKDGDYLKYWAVPKSTAPALAADYSTPSGHAMASAAFYPYLAYFWQNKFIRYVSAAAVLCIGISRPYLGVHYIEDILIGWTLGGAISFASVRYSKHFSSIWTTLTFLHQVIFIVACSAVLIVLSLAIGHMHQDLQPRTLASYAGFLSGIVVGRPLEMRSVNFDPSSGAPVQKLIRYVLSVGLVLLTISIIGFIDGKVAGKTTLVGYALEYLRYVIGGIISIYFAPLLFTRAGLAKRAPVSA